MSSQAIPRAADKVEAAEPEGTLPAHVLLEREMRVRCDVAPHSLFDEPLLEHCWQMNEHEFLLRAEGSHYFHYARGAGITIERGEDADPSEESLWLNGSVYAAIASLNGFLPIHASAVAYQGAVFAFTGPAGAGKSTLVAALGKHGLPLFCDDTLVLDLADPNRIICLPGHKRLKLRPDAIELTGAARMEKVSRSYDKYYAEPSGGIIDVAMPLARLIFLEDGPELAIGELPPSERFVRAADDHYSWVLFQAARRFNRTAAFDHRARIARQVRMTRLVRPFDPERFDESVGFAAAHVKGRA